MSKLDNKNISKHLGKTSKYKSQYDPSLLVREPRSSNRKHLDIKEKDLPFVGYDVWNGYEVSGLLNNGVPISAVAKVVSHLIKIAPPPGDTQLSSLPASPHPAPKDPPGPFG